MLATSVRVSPCSEREARWSSGRVTDRVPSATRSTRIGDGTVWLSVPLGPLTVTCAPSMVTSTPAGTVIGSRPMRDMSYLPHQT